MKQKLKIGLLLWSLIMLLGAIGLGGCDKDDDFSKDDFSKDDFSKEVYEGYVQKAVSGVFTIKVTYSPFNDKDADINMPGINQLMYGYISDSPEVELEFNQKLSFIILSAKALYTLYPYDDEPLWKCEIKILKQY